MFAPTDGDEGSDAFPGTIDWDDIPPWPGYEIALGISEVQWIEPIEPLFAGE